MRQRKFVTRRESVPCDNPVFSVDGHPVRSDPSGKRLIGYRGPGAPRRNETGCGS